MKAYIHGSQCEVGFDVLRTNQPMSAYFESFYQTMSCKFWVCRLQIFCFLLLCFVSFVIVFFFYFF